MLGSRYPTLFVYFGYLSLMVVGKLQYSSSSNLDLIDGHTYCGLDFTVASRINFESLNI